MMKKGDLLELDIEDLAYGCRAVARQEGFVWFVRKGLPGQKVLARVRKIKKSWGEASIEQLLHPSPYQVHPPCPRFSICGGCQLQHFDYSIQTYYKTKQVRDILERIGGLKDVRVADTIPAEKIYYYRNKMEFSFSDQRWRIADEVTEKPPDFALGLHVPGNFRKVLDIDACLLQPNPGNEILKTTRELTCESSLKPYGITTHEGFWRFLVIRTGHNTGDLMLNLITSGQDLSAGSQEVDRIAQQLKVKHPEITTLIHSISDRKAQAAFSDSERILFGSGKIREKIGAYLFEISPNAFFQTNTIQTKILFQTVMDMAGLQGDENVYDLYCGTGAIGIFLADRAKQILGIEVIESAIEDGRRNVELNNLTNIRFHLADMKDALKDTASLTDKYGKPDIVILDPPRGGTHPNTIKGLLNLEPPKIIYVSCNPTILARDLAFLCEEIYEIEGIQPVDMFPHTGHIEVVVVLVKKE